MGMVLAVRHLTLGELFAVKVMLPEMVDHPEALGRFLREARASARLHGEHVARVHDVGTLESGIPYMVLEYLEGSDLEKELSFRGALGVGEVAGYVFQVGEALLEAHGLGIVHRDLKPANLFLTRRANGTACIKVLDFGISKEAGGADKISQKLTQTGAIMGSPHYMSPEQLVDGKNVDGRSDIWALGIILYELATGTMPFHAETMPEIVAKVLSTQPAAPSQLRPGIAPAFDALVARCIEKNRDNRFQSVQEFMAALRPFVNENDTRASAAIQVTPRANAGQTTLAQSAIGLEHETVVFVPPGKRTSTGSSLGRIWMIAAGVSMLVTLIVVAVVAVRPHSPEREALEPAMSTDPATVKPAAPAPEATSTTTATATTTTINRAPASSAMTTTTATSAATHAPPVVTATATATTTVKTKNKVKGFDE
jgi:serine/threonine-protein kinase